MWAESVMEVVFAGESDLPFLLTDNPVTVYNKACFPGSKHCIYPNQPDIGLMGSQTIFPLDRERCLILTNLEYARKPTMKAGLLKPRTNARYFSDDVGMVRYDKVVRERHLSTKQVSAINYILKKLATKFIAVVDEDHAYPERHLKSTLWNKLGDILMPDSLGVSMTGGEIFAFGAGDKLFHTQDEFGRVPSSPAEREAKLREALKMRETVMEALAKHNREKEGKE